MRFLPARFAPVATALSVMLLASCTDFYEPKPSTTGLTDKTVLSNTSSLTHMIVRGGKTDLITCSQPAPDAAFDQGEAGDVAFTLIDLGGDDEGDEDTETEELEMAGRTPAVLITRELFYRACEFSQNYKLDKKEALELYKKTLDSVTQVWATEAGNTTVTVDDTVSTTATTGITSSNANTIAVSDTKSDTSSESNSVTTDTSTSQ